MMLPATRRYRLVGALLAAAVLLPVVLAASPEEMPATAGSAVDLAARPEVQRPAPGETANGAGGAAPDGAAATPPAGSAATPVAPRVRRLLLGSFQRPATGIQRRSGVPRGVPVVPEAGRVGRGRARTLTVRTAETARFAAIGVTWAGGSTDRDVISVAARVHVPGKGWGPWHTAGASPADRDPDGAPDPAEPPQRRSRPRSGHDPGAADRRAPAPSRRGGADLMWFGPANGVEVMVTGGRGSRVADIAVDLIDPLEAPGDAGAAESAPAGHPGGGRVPMPPIARRAAWGADEKLMTWHPEYARTVKAVTWHHTATGNDYEPADVPRILRAIYYHQAVARGWGDIGYNVLVDRFGRLWEGRYGGLARAVVGAHAGGFNRYTAGIAVIGDHRGVPVPAATTEAAARYIAWKLSLGPAVDPRGTTTLTGGGSTSRHPPGTTVTVPRVFPHRTTNPTECPGAKGMDALPALRERAYALMGVWGETATVRMRLATWRPADVRYRILGAGEPAFVGTPGDVPVPADYDGDGVADLATWSPTTALWRIANSGGGTAEQLTLGSPGDRPVPADYDGDGRAEPAVWRPAEGSWLVRGQSPVAWGRAGDVPLPADYDGDGRTDLAVWRPGDGTWYVRGVANYRLGESYHVPVPADYNGDGAVEPASWSPVSHRWFVWGMEPAQFGAAGDVPVPGQYDGDGRADLAVWRPPAAGAEASWLVNRIGSFRLGAAGDVPTPLG